MAVEINSAGKLNDCSKCEIFTDAAVAEEFFLLDTQTFLKQSTISQREKRRCTTSECRRAIDAEQATTLHDSRILNVNAGDQCADSSLNSLKVHMSANSVPPVQSPTRRRKKNEKATFTGNFFGMADGTSINSCSEREVKKSMQSSNVSISTLEETKTCTFFWPAASANTDRALA